MKTLIGIGILLSTRVGAMSAWATVGGDVRLLVLGYEPIDQKVYVLHQYEDGWGGYRLYYFDFKSKNPNTPIEAVSYYPDPNFRGGTDEDVGFMTKLTNLKKRLHPLPKLAPHAIKVVINHQSQKSVPMPYDPDHHISEYRYQYHLTHGKYRSLPQTAVAYHTPNLTITQAYQIPKHHKILVAIQYLDEPMETGYTTEHPVVLSFTN